MKLTYVVHARDDDYWNVKKFRRALNRAFPQAVFDLAEEHDVLVRSVSEVENRK